mmetsp:Transcript_27610/g.67931  ORF Transcript_27610/g.67931 Transcript_27610/m.67931 type:complete len:626 (+) Transcript_27610:398-2275(+)
MRAVRGGVLQRRRGDLRHVPHVVEHERAGADRGRAAGAGAVVPHRLHRVQRLRAGGPVLHVPAGGIPGASVRGQVAADHGVRRYAHHLQRAELGRGLCAAAVRHELGLHLHLLPTVGPAHRHSGAVLPDVHGRQDGDGDAHEREHQHLCQDDPECDLAHRRQRAVGAGGPDDAALHHVRHHLLQRAGPQVLRALHVHQAAQRRVLPQRRPGRHLLEHRHLHVAHRDGDRRHGGLPAVRGGHPSEHRRRADVRQQVQLPGAPAVPQGVRVPVHQVRRGVLLVGAHLPGPALLHVRAGGVLPGHAVVADRHRHAVLRAEHRRAQLRAPLPQARHGRGGRREPAGHLLLPHQRHAVQLLQGDAAVPVHVHQRAHHGAGVGHHGRAAVHRMERRAAGAGGAQRREAHGGAHAGGAGGRGAGLPRDGRRPREGVPRRGQGPVGRALHRRVQEEAEGNRPQDGRRPHRDHLPAHRRGRQRHCQLRGVPKAYVAPLSAGHGRRAAHLERECRVVLPPPVQHEEQAGRPGQGSGGVPERHQEQDGPHAEAPQHRAGGRTGEHVPAARAVPLCQARAPGRQHRQVPPGGRLDVAHRGGRQPRQRVVPHGGGGVLPQPGEGQPLPHRLAAHVVQG